MDYTVRRKIIQELYELFDEYLFESITDPACYRGRQVFDIETETPPIITVLPRVEEGQLNQYGMQELRMPVDIACLARIGTENPSDLGEAILGELVSCVFGKEVEDADGDPVKRGGLTMAYADAIRYRTGGIESYPDELGQQIINVGITVEIRYQTQAGDPYSNE